MDEPFINVEWGAERQCEGDHDLKLDEVLGFWSCTKCYYWAPEVHLAIPTLTEFLLARIAEDEATAKALTHGHYPTSRAEIEYQDRFTRDRMLAECEAKRRIVERFQAIAAGEGETIELAFHEQGLFEAVGYLAAIYADHPDCRQEWRP